MLIIFGGLPGTGKSTLSQAAARHLNAVHLRVDTIEQTLRDVGFTEIGGEGYAIGYRLAADNLALGNTVIADSCNPIDLTRDAWKQVGELAGVKVIEIEIICSDLAEHQRRVESRQVNIPGLVLPDWKAVLGRHYEPWEREHIVIDTAGVSIEDSISKTMAVITQSA
jgi:predicted kinase